MCYAKKAINHGKKTSDVPGWKAADFEECI